MSLCQHCISGVLHEGTPEGKFEIIDGVNTYIALPPTGQDYPKDKAVLILTGNPRNDRPREMIWTMFTDVFGIQLINNQVWMFLVDSFRSESDLNGHTSALG